MNGTLDLNLTSFSQEMFWDEPPEGLFEVDVGLQQLSNQHLMAFADVNSDKYTDVITLSEDASSFSIYLFNQRKSRFEPSRTVKPTDCQEITNIVVGRSITNMRLFVTCKQVSTGQTIVRLFDRTPEF
jgi:hypothetical protein